jgi:NAD(P)-dependent dehydrogenase (short-subunit alcohol dehydrogenase family)
MGATVILAARSAERLGGVVDQIQAAGGAAMALPCDVGRPEDCQRLVDQAIARYERLDSLVNNAGVLQPLGAFADSQRESWEHNLAVNLFGQVNLTREALPHLRRSRGRVIHVSSGMALNPIAGASAYSVAKAALNQFNRALALEEPLITSIALRPGVVDTDMQTDIRREGKDGLPPDRYDFFVGLHRDGQLLPPEAPGRAIALLALHAPHEWSGEFIKWNDKRINSLG